MYPSKSGGEKDAPKLISSCPQFVSSTQRRRQSKGLKTAALYFLSVAILLSLPFTVGEIDNVCGVQREDIDWDKRCGSSDEGGFVDAARERVSARTINIIDPTQNLPELLTSPRLNGARDRIWVVFAYHKTCEFSLELLRKLNHHAIPSIKFTNDDLGQVPYFHYPEMNFVPMPIGENEVGVHLEAQILKRVGITRLPSLFFLWDEEQDLENTLPLENVFDEAEVYRGRCESVSGLVNGLYHYLSRLQLRSSSTKKRQEHQQRDGRSPLAAIRVESLIDLRDIIRNSNGTNILQNPPLPLDPDLSEADQRWIRYLMDDEAGETDSGPDNHRDINDNNDHRTHYEEVINEEVSSPQRDSITRRPYHVIVQCRNYRGEKMIDEIRDGLEDANFQARRSSLRNSILQLYQEYDQAVKVLGIRHDALFSILEPGPKGQNSHELSLFCDPMSDDGLVRVWDFHSNESVAEFKHDDNHHEGLLVYDYVNNSAGLINRLSSWLRPDVLWFDRRMTAPIAFHPRYRRHAVLFVDFHDRTSASETRNAIRIFRQECRRLRIEHQSNPVPHQSVTETIYENFDGGNDFVCLIVPSTQIRVLNTFGIDIWTNLDRQASEKIKATLCNSHDGERNDRVDNNVCDSVKGHQQSKYSETDGSKFSSILPSVLITDRQKNGAIQRYYLDPPINSRTINEFFGNFIHGRIEPERKVSQISFDDDHLKGEKSDFPANKHSIQLLTADSLPYFLEENREKHVLVEFYAPTCGHCKRFNTIWNSLGTLIEFLGWSDKLVLARIDITSNEISVPGMTATWLPDLFYFGIGVSENPIHFGNTQLAEQVELGSINDPLELLEWWMDEARDAINEAELLHDLEKVIATFS